jgi:hypothetical protein
VAADTHEERAGRDLVGRLIAPVARNGATSTVIIGYGTADAVIPVLDTAIDMFTPPA